MAVVHSYVFVTDVMHYKVRRVNWSITTITQWDFNKIDSHLKKSAGLMKTLAYSRSFFDFKINILRKFLCIENKMNQIARNLMC